MKAVLISIQPKWVEKIASGEKTIEVRKSRPKLETPFKCYIYCTKEKVKDDFVTISGAFGLIRCPECAIYNRAKEYDCNGKVIGEFVCDRIDDFLVFENGTVQYWNCHELEKSCLTYNELSKYIGKNKKGYGWHISQLKIYDKPKELSEFYKECKDVKDFPNSCRRKSCDHYYEEWQNCYAECCFNVERPLERPPQSWCYVEGVQNG